MTDELNPTSTDNAPQAGPPLTPPGAPAATPPSAPPGVRVVDGGVTPVYANYCELRRTPEEVILNLGLDESTAGGVPVRLHAKVILTFWTAKRLATLLQHVVADHERAFGALELNPQRRLRPTA